MQALSSLTTSVTHSSRCDVRVGDIATPLRQLAWQWTCVTYFFFFTAFTAASALMKP